MTDGTDHCDRRGCGRDPEYQMRTESPILHEDPTEWYLCEEHIHVAIREFRGSTNILTSREITAQPEAKQKKLVTDGGTDRSVSDEYAIREDVCGLFCDAEPEVSFVDEWGIEVHWCRECYERPCDHCGGEIEEVNKRKGMCQDRRDEISMWGGDEERAIEKDPDNEQTTLMTDGGQSVSGTEHLPPDRLTKDELYEEIVEIAGLPEKQTTAAGPFRKEHLVELVRYLRPATGQEGNDGQ